MMQSEEEERDTAEVLSPGYFEMTSSKGCVKRMMVEYSDDEGQKQQWNESGYFLICFLPRGATDIRVTFSVVGGGQVYAVDRTQAKRPWVKQNGRYFLEEFRYAEPPDSKCAIRYELAGSSFHCYVHDVKPL